MTNPILDPLVIPAQNRKLKAVWSMETQQDHNLQAEDALATIMAKEIQQIFDQEILNDLRCTKKKKYRSIDDPWEV